MNVTMRFCKKDKSLSQLAEQLKKANYKITISHPFHGSIPIMWVDEACYTGLEKIVQAVTELLGK